MGQIEALEGLADGSPRPNGAIFARARRPIAVSGTPAALCGGRHDSHKFLYNHDTLDCRTGGSVAAATLRREVSCVRNRKPAPALRRGKAQLVIRAAMTFTLAFRNLFHDRIRLAVTMVGILFSIVLVAVQLGLYLGARNIIVSMIDRVRRRPVDHGLRHQELRGGAADQRAREIRRAVDPGRRQGRAASSSRSRTGASRRADRRSWSSSAPTPRTAASSPGMSSRATFPASAHAMP